MFSYSNSYTLGDYFNYCKYTLHSGSNNRKKEKIMWTTGIMLLLLFFITHIDTPLKTITTNSFTVGVTIETTKNNVNNLDGVHIIF